MNNFTSTSFLLFIYFMLGVFRSSVYFYESSSRVFLDIGMCVVLTILVIINYKKNLLNFSFYVFSAILFLRLNSLSFHLISLIFLSNTLLDYHNNLSELPKMLIAPFWGSFTGTLIVVFSSLTGFVQDEIFVPLTTIAQKKSYGFFNPNVGAIYFSSIIIYLLISKKTKIIHLPIYIIAIFLIYETHSRAAALAVLSSILFFVGQWFYSETLKKKIIITTIAILPVFGLIVYLSFSLDQYFLFLDKTLWNRIDFLSSFRLSRIIIAYENSSLISMLVGTAKNVNHELGWLNYIMLFGLIHVILGTLIVITFIYKNQTFNDKKVLNYCFILIPTFFISNFIENLFFSYNLFALMFFIPFCYVMKVFFESIKMAIRNPKNIPDSTPVKTSITL